MALAVGRDLDRKPLAFADVADNPGGGGRGNTTFLLRAFHEARVAGALPIGWPSPSAATLTANRSPLPMSPTIPAAAGAATRPSSCAPFTRRGSRARFRSDGPRRRPRP